MCPNFKASNNLISMKSSTVNRAARVFRVAFFSIVLTACTYNKTEPFSNGVITGPDMRMCPSPCCGGWIIKIDGGTYIFSELPANSGIDLDKEKFPLKVDVVWSRDTTLRLNCNHIIIQQIDIISN